MFTIRSLPAVIAGVFLWLPALLPPCHAYDVNPPIHQYIALEATKIWQEIPEEILRYARQSISAPLDGQCTAGYNVGDDIIIGSGEEDEDKDPVFGLIMSECLPVGESCEANEGRNGYLEHFWDPDQPNVGGYNCEGMDDTRGGFNAGLRIDLTGFGVPNPANGHYDSAYRLAQDYWDNKVIPFYVAGKTEEAYYWLGRIAHLLTDLTVPAHAHLLPHDPIVGGQDYFETYFKRLSTVAKYRGTSLKGREYRFEQLPNLSGLDWYQIHPHPTNLFKLFWYVAQKTQYFASKGKGRSQASGNSRFVRLDGTAAKFAVSLWQGEGTPVTNPNVVATRVRLMADALIPHAMKSVAGLYRLFWLETHP